MSKTLFTRLGPESSFKEIEFLLAAIKQEAIPPEKIDKPDNNEVPSEILKEAQTEDGSENEEPQEDGVEEDPIPLIESRLNDLEQSINQLADYITKFQNATDQVMLPTLENVISNMRLDYKSAYELTTFYTKGWFSRSFMSLEGKRRFAEFLYKTIKPYCNSNLETLDMIRKGDPDVSLFISYPRSSL